MSSYSIFTFETVHNVHFGISKMVKKNPVSYLFSCMLRSVGRQKKRKPFGNALNTAASRLQSIDERYRK